MRKVAGNGLGDTVGLVGLGHHNSDPRGGICDSYDGNGSRRRFL